MKTVGLLILGVAILLFVAPILSLDADFDAAQVLAKDKEKDKDKDEKKKDDEKKDGKSKFGDDDEEKEGKKKDEVPDKPVPATYSLSDYRLQLTLEDSRFWKHDTNYTDDEAKRNVVLKLQLKRPKSDDHFDVIITANTMGHNMKYTYPDGTAIGGDNYKRLAEKRYDDETSSWKSVKNKKKPKSMKLSRDAGKAYFYSFTGMTPGGAFPLHREMYFFKYKDKTYAFSILFTTTSAKNKGIKAAVDKMMKSIKVKKKKKKRR